MWNTSDGRGRVISHQGCAPTLEPIGVTTEDIQIKYTFIAFVGKSIKLLHRVLYRTVSYCISISTSPPQPLWSLPKGKSDQIVHTFMAFAKKCWKVRSAHGWCVSSVGHVSNTQDKAMLEGLQCSKVVSSHLLHMCSISETTPWAQV